MPHLEGPPRLLGFRDQPFWEPTIGVGAGYAPAMDEDNKFRFGHQSNTPAAQVHVSALARCSRLPQKTPQDHTPPRS